jgi:predicted dehydrogenase
MGYIGCGGITHSHTKRLVVVPEAEIVALTDIDPKRITGLKQSYPAIGQAREYTDYKKMLKAEELDAVLISTPHTLHYEHASAALKAGLHVLQEKPMVCTVAHARRLIELAKKAGAVLEICYQRHFSGPFRYMRDVIANGDIGKVRFVSALQMQEWVHLTGGTWRHKMALSGGGQLNDSGSHLMDIILWTTGLAADTVAAQMEFFGGEVDINSALTIRFANGAIGSISIIGSAPAWWEDITVEGTKGALFYRNGTLKHQMGLNGPVSTIDNWPPNLSHDGNFINAILGREENQVPPECGLRVIEVTEAAYKSHARKGAVVKIRRS